jgi:hypothetical protein
MEKKSQLIDPSEQEIVLSFTNYKLLKKEDFTLKGSNIYFVKGPNEVGKTSVLNAIKAALEIKDDTKQKVTKGEVEGVNEFVFPGADGKPYRVKYEFTDTSTKFVMFDPEGNKISKVTDMRGIFKYNHVDATEFISWSHTAEGRRKQKELILNLLPPEKYVEYMDLENAITEDFNKRTIVSKSIAVKESLLKEYKVSSEDQQFVDNHQAAINLLQKKREEHNQLILNAPDRIAVEEKLSALNNTLSNNTSMLTDIEEQIKRLQERHKLLTESNVTVKKDIEVLNNTLSKIEKDEVEYNTKYNAVIESIKKGEAYVLKSTEVINRKKKYDETYAQYNTLVEDEKALTDKISLHRKEKEKIITNSNFPVENLSFDENGYLTINGFLFDENQVCESDVILLVAQILCRINDNPIQVIGDASLLDFKKLDKLYDIAKENGKIMFVDEIDRNLDKLVIVGYEKHDKNASPKTPKVEKTETKENLF